MNVRPRREADRLGPGKGPVYEGANRQYADQIDARHRATLEERPPAPVNVPQQAYGPQLIQWSQARAPVWAWCRRSGRMGERRKSYLKDHKDHVCVVWVDGPGG